MKQARLPLAAACDGVFHHPVPNRAKGGRRVENNRDTLYEGRDQYDMDIDRMVNEGLGGGQVSDQNGLIEESTTDTMTGASSARDNR
jgi:hypothetical protein